jgi:hypothetical protein
MAYRLTITEVGGTLTLTPSGSDAEGRVVTANQKHRVYRNQHVEWISNDGAICITFNQRLNNPNPFDGGDNRPPEEIIVAATKGQATRPLKVRSKNYDGTPLKYWVALLIGRNQYIWDPELEDGGDPPPPPTQK